MGGTQLGGFTLTIRGHQGGRVTVIAGCILKDAKKNGFFAHLQLIQKELFAKLNHDKGQFSIVRRLQSCKLVLRMDQRLSSVHLGLVCAFHILSAKFVWGTIWVKMLSCIGRKGSGCGQAGHHWLTNLSAFAAACAMYALCLALLWTAMLSYVILHS